MPFKKGNQANKGGVGRPRLDNSIALTARRHTEEAFQVLINALKNPSTETAMKAANSILDRGWGKPKEHVELTGEDGGPIATTSIPATIEWIERVLRRGENPAPPTPSKN